MNESINYNIDLLFIIVLSYASLSSFIDLASSLSFFDIVSSLRTDYLFVIIIFTQNNCDSQKYCKIPQVLSFFHFYSKKYQKKMEKQQSRIVATTIVLLLSVIIVVSCCISQANAQVVSVIMNPVTSTFSIVEGIQKDNRLCIVWGVFKDNITENGWGELTVSTSNQVYPEAYQAQALGFAEGYLTQTRIFQAYTNWNLSNPPLNDKVKQFVKEQWDWMANQSSQWHNDDYWKHVKYLLNQATGLYQGYDYATKQNQITDQSLSFDEIYTLTNAGDLEDLVPAFNQSSTKTQKQLECSGLVKLTQDFSELFLGHSTFNMYMYMLRIFKHYHTSFQFAASQTTSFSSRPGDLESKDDFYILPDTLLGVIETSLDIFDLSLYKQLTPNSVPTWLRCQLANRLAHTAEQWTQYFAMYNSGTHNNEWIVVDYKQFAKRNIQTKQLAPKTVYLLDQIPGHISVADMTDLLSKQGYIPSYNIPYWHVIYVLSGYPGNFEYNFTYETYPRSRIFKEHQGQVKNIEDMKKLMRLNNWEHEVYSLGNPCWEISSRCDLKTKEEGGKAFGGIDSKVISAEIISKDVVHAVSGPTHDTQPVFSFEPKWKDVPHVGMPDAWNFNWTVMTTHSFV